MLPPIHTINDYRALRRDTETQRVVMTALAERHGLAVSELRPFAGGTHVVWRAGAAVIKVFAPLWPQDAAVELTMLRHVTGTGLCVPQISHEGEIEGWPYVVMSHVCGAPIGDVWHEASRDERVSLAHQIGETAAGLAALPTTGLEHLRVDQDAVIAERLPKLRADQRARGGDDALDVAMERFLANPPVLAPAPSVLLHADLTDDHFLVEDGRIVGLIDFADAFIGPWTYELAAPACFMTRGDEECERALLAGRGVEPTEELLRSLPAWCVLHRYAHIAYMMREARTDTFEEWFGAFWAWGSESGGS